MTTDNPDNTDDTLDLVRSLRDTIRECAHRAEDQNAQLRSSYDAGFFSPIPGESGILQDPPVTPPLNIEPFPLE